jgi:hypothetical protein
MGEEAFVEGGRGFEENFDPIRRVIFREFPRGVLERGDGYNITSILV